MKPLLSFAVALCCFVGVLRADTSRPTDCDTLITYTGLVISANIVSETRESIRYYQCGDTSRALYVVPRDLVKKVKRAPAAVPEGARVDLPEGARPADFWVKEQKQATLLSAFSMIGAFVGLFLLAGALLFSATTIFLLAIALLLSGGICGVALLRLSERHASLRKYRKRARLAIWLSFGVLTLVVVLLLLLFTIVALYLWE